MKIPWLIELASFYVEDFTDEDAINVKQNLGDGILYFSTKIAQCVVFSNAIKNI